MKRVVSIFFVVFMLSTASAFADTSSVAAGNLEFGIANLFSIDRIWNDSSDYTVIGLGTIGFGQRGTSEMLLFQSPAFTFGYFIIDGLALGLRGGYNFIKEDDDPDPIHIWFVGPEVKFYLGVTESILIDTHASCVYYGLDTGSNEYDRINIGLGAGLNILFTRNFAGFINLDYTYYFEQNRDGASQANSDFHDIGISAGLKVFVTFND